MSEKMREAIVAYMAAGVGNWTDYEKQADARRLAIEALAEQFASTVKPALVVYGDGEHDDTDALQAYFDGSRKVVNQDGTPFEFPGAPGTRYRIGRALIVRDTARTALAAPPAPSVPDGWKLVPVEPTDEMIDAGCDASNAYRVDMDRSYQAMLAAAPEVKP